MRNAVIKGLLAAFIILVLGMTENGFSASRKQRSSTPSASEIKTEFFSIRIPNGWRMLKPVKTHPNGDVSAVFVPDNASLAVTINIIHVPVSAKVVAESTAQNISKTGFQATTPQEKQGIWHFSISGKENGQAWFGANGKICAVVLMFGTNYTQADALLNNLESPYKNIFPATVDG